MVRVGDPAPDFKLKGTDGKEHSLADLKGQWVVLFFFPKAFTTVCQSEVIEFSKRAADFAAQKAVVLGCSIDSDAALRAWAKHLGGLNITLLSDLRKDVGRRYGVLLDHEGFHLRGTYVIDPDGKIRSMVMNETRTGRSMEESLRTLQAIQTDASCPAEWKPGTPTL
jgi:peroxiredoxin (alkyl hydroperoxide reductase subunit C)